MVIARDLMIDAGQRVEDLRPAAIVDLDALSGEMIDIMLPACPLIGVGDPAHPLAARLDVMVEAPVTLDGLIASVCAHPHAAAVLVHLLRATAGQAMEAALVQESLAYGVLQGGAEHAAWLVARPHGAGAAPGAVRLDRVDDRLDIGMDRAVARNAVDRPMRDGLYEAFSLAALDPDVRQVVLRGAGKAFCVGADLEEFGTTRDPALAHRIRMATLPAHAIVRCRDRFMAYVQGACVGAGLEMAAFAARMVATPDAWFQLPELAMGLLPGAGGTVSVPRRIGRQRAALMMLSGKRISARTALSWGLVDEIAVDERGADIAG